jgi:prepilin-type N-terminal cleavage/methylation domain-containing protein
MKKAMTLAELLMAVALLGVVVLAAFSLDSTARSFLVSSQAKALVTNRLMTALDHIQKKAYRHNGNAAVASAVFSNDGTELLFSVDNLSAPTPTDFSDDRVVRYRFDDVTGKLMYCSDWDGVLFSCSANQQEIVDNVDTFTFENMTDSDGFVYGLFVNATAYVDRAKHKIKKDARRNPAVAFNGSVYFEERSVR